MPKHTIYCACCLEEVYIYGIIYHRYRLLIFV
nr:MAG TPA: hypothetical protein [Caudoviricetes sp.]